MRTRSSRRVPVLFLVALSTCAAHGAEPPAETVHEWPQYKGNAGFTGLSADDSVKPPLKLKWTFRLDGDASNDAGGGVIVAGRRVFVPVANTKSIVALDADTGRFVWQYDGYLAAIRKVPTWHDGRLILWNREPAGDRVPKYSTVVALDANTGKELWKRELRAVGTDPNRAGLPVADGRIFAAEGGDDPAVVALDAKTGDVVWRTPLGNEDGTSVICPAVAGGKVIVGTLNDFGWRKADRGSIVALDAATGRILWRRRDQFPDKTLVSDGRVVANSLHGRENTKFFLLDAATGETLWTGRDRFHYSPATIAADVVLVKPYGGSVVAADRTTGKELWTFDAKANSGCCTPVVSGKFAYFGTGVPSPGDVEALSAFQRVDAPREQGRVGTLFALDLRTGEPAWRFSTGNTICGEPALAYGRLYFAGRDGRVYCFEPARDGEPTTPESPDRSDPAPLEEVERLLGPQFVDRPRPGRDWPTLGGSNDRTHAGDVRLEAPLERAWAIETGDRIVTTPVVRDGRVFVGSESGRLVAADVADGRTAWEFDAGGPIRCTAAAASDLVYCGSDSGALVALDVRTGTKRWTFRAGGPVQGSPALVAGIVVFAANDHHVYALDRFTGRTLWRFRTNDYATFAAPVVHGERVFVGQGTDWVWALDLKTGKSLWRSFVPLTIEAVAFHRDRVYARSPYWVVELDPATGKRLRIGAASCGYGGLAFAGGHVFQSGWQGQYGTSGGTLLDLDDPGGEPPKIPTLEDVRSLRQRSLKGAPDLASMAAPLVAGNRLGFATLAGKAIVTEADGTRVWSADLAGRSHAPPVFADGLLLVGDDTGRLTAFRSATDGGTR